MKIIMDIFNQVLQHSLSLKPHLKIPSKTIMAIIASYRNYLHP